MPGSPSESSSEPSTQLKPDSPTSMPSSRERSIAARAVRRARSTRPRCASTIVGANAWLTETGPSCASSSREAAAQRSASTQFPARHSVSARYHRALACPGTSPRALSASLDLVQELARPVDCARPPELMARDERAAVVEGPVGKRALERKGLLHLRLRDALAGVEAEEPVGGERTAAERPARRIARRRRRPAPRDRALARLLPRSASARRGSGGSRRRGRRRSSRQARWREDRVASRGLATIRASWMRTIARSRPGAASSRASSRRALARSRFAAT